MTLNQTNAEDATSLLPSSNDIEQARQRIRPYVSHTPLEYDAYLSEKYQADVFLKREDKQRIRSFKIRGALNRLLQLNEKERSEGVVCASAGNHSQGIALACSLLNLKGTIFMPEKTPSQKVSAVKKYGRDQVTIHLGGAHFDDAYEQALNHCNQYGGVLVHPFDDFDVISGQGTVAAEILEDATFPFDYLITPVGGGGLASGVSTYFKQHSANTCLVGVEPEHAAALHYSLQMGYNCALPTIDPFVDGAATRKVGELGFQICRTNLNRLLTIHEGHTCQTLIELYQELGIVAEPAGCLSIAALDKLANQIKGKRVVCVLSGGNNDMQRFAEINRRADQFRSAHNEQFQESDTKIREIG